MTDGLSCIRSIREFTNKAFLAFESSNHEACIEAFAEIQDQINQFVLWSLEQSEKEGLGEARKEIERVK